MAVQESGSPSRSARPREGLLRRAARHLPYSLGIGFGLYIGFGIVPAFGTGGRVSRSV